MEDTDQKLWDLLDRSPRPQAPPFFAGKVMHAIGESQRSQRGWFDAILRWSAPAAIAALVALAVLPRNESPKPSLSASGEITALDLVEIVSPDDYAILTAAGWPYDNGFLSAGL